MESDGGYNPEEENKPSKWKALFTKARGVSKSILRPKSAREIVHQEPVNPLKRDMDPKLYLRKHLENTDRYPRESEYNPRAELYRPLEGEVVDENGQFQFKNNNIEISYKHQNVEEVPIHGRGPYAESTSAAEFQLASDLEIKHPSNNYVIKVDELLPGFKIYLKPDHDTVNKGDGSYIDNEKKAVFIFGNPLNMATWLTTAHEIGHEKDSFQNGSMEVNEAYGNAVARARGIRAPFEDSARWLRGERNPWAYAIKLMKPFIGEGQAIRKEALLDMIHNRNLALYSESIKYHSGDANWAEIHGLPWAHPRMGRNLEEGDDKKEKEAA